MEHTKITAMISTKLLATFNRDIDRLFLKRDAFLNQMISVETGHLAEDLKGKRLSAKGRRYIAGELKRVGTTPVNIKVEKAVANALNEVVKETNIVRDAFINRMLWLLRGGTALLDYLDLPKFVTYSEFEEYVPDPMPTAPLEAMHSVQRDPLYYLRLGCEERHHTGLYLLPLPPKLNGLECWIDDALVAGTDSYIDADALLKEIDALDAEAFRNFNTKPAPAKEDGHD